MTLSPDILNGLFELFSGLFVLNHCRVIMKDKAVAGVSIISAAFFVVWGLWNLYYYPQLGQTFSFYAGIILCLSNAFWVSLLIKYSRRESYTYSYRWITATGVKWHECDEFWYKQYKTRPDIYETKRS